MNRAFGPWRLVNTYGAFGTVSKTRYEVELQGTADEYPTESAGWLPYEFVGKPGDVDRRPPWLSPYHLRLDWLMWFLPLGAWRRHEWLLPLTQKLLANDAQVSALLRRNPFVETGAPPRWVRLKRRLPAPQPLHTDDLQDETRRRDTPSHAPLNPR